MKTSTFSTILCACGLFTSAQVLALDAATQDEAIGQARQLIQRYGGNLKKELKQAIKSGGVAQAVETCHLKAPDIASDLSDQSGWTVRRTSLKVRNLEDAPDRWETRVLEQFEQRRKAGEPLDHMDYSETVTRNGKTLFRYMKAIPTGKICLKCHGESVDSQVEKQLDSLYPFDQARGFHVGDIRGAFSVSKEVK